MKALSRLDSSLYFKIVKILYSFPSSFYFFAEFSFDQLQFIISRPKQRCNLSPASNPPTPGFLFNKRLNRRNTLILQLVEWKSWVVTRLCVLSALLPEGLLSVVHIGDSGMDVLNPLKITGSHVLVQVSHFSAFGIVRDFLKRLWYRNTRPVSGQVLLFLGQLNPKTQRQKLNVFLLPRNIHLDQVFITLCNISRLHENNSVCANTEEPAKILLLPLDPGPLQIICMWWRRKFRTPYSVTVHPLKLHRFLGYFHGISMWSSCVKNLILKSTFPTLVVNWKSLRRIHIFIRKTTVEASIN